MHLIHDLVVAEVNVSVDDDEGEDVVDEGLGLGVRFGRAEYLGKHLCVCVCVCVYA
jgi:hypothetical protein